MQNRLKIFEEKVVGGLPRSCSANAYLYCDSGEPVLGVTIVAVSTDRSVLEAFDLPLDPMTG